MGPIGCPETSVSNCRYTLRTAGLSTGRNCFVCQTMSLRHLQVQGRLFVWRCSEPFQHHSQSPRFALFPWSLSIATACASNFALWTNTTFCTHIPAEMWTEPAAICLLPVNRWTVAIMNQWQGPWGHLRLTTCLRTLSSWERDHWMRLCLRAPLIIPAYRNGECS